MSNDQEKGGESFAQWENGLRVMTELVARGFRQSTSQGIPGEMVLEPGRLDRLVEISGAKNLWEFMLFVFEHSGDHQAVEYGEKAIRMGLEALDSPDGEFAARLEILIEDIAVANMDDGEEEEEEEEEELNERLSALRVDRPDFSLEELIASWGKWRKSPNPTRKEADLAIIDIIDAERRIAATLDDKGLLKEFALSLLRKAE